MNRRGFLSTMLKAAAGFTIMPPATTYARVWRAERETIEIYSDWSAEKVEFYNSIPFTFAYRVNVTGIHEELKKCAVAIEPLDATHPLDIGKLADRLYAIKRQRERTLFNSFFFDRPIPK